MQFSSLNLILERVAHQNKPVTIFFASIKGFSKFFSWSPKRTQIGLKKIATRRASNTRYRRCQIAARIEGFKILSTKLQRAVSLGLNNLM
jgi:hypothetical protein